MATPDLDKDRSIGHAKGPPEGQSPANPAADGAAKDLSGQIGWLRECLDQALTHTLTSCESATVQAVPVSHQASSPKQSSQQQQQHIEEQLQHPHPAHLGHHEPPAADGSPIPKLEEITASCPESSVDAILPRSEDAAELAGQSIGNPELYKAAILNICCPCIMQAFSNSQACSRWLHACTVSTSNCCTRPIGHCARSSASSKPPAICQPHQ